MRPVALAVSTSAADRASRKSSGYASAIRCTQSICSRVWATWSAPFDSSSTKTLQNWPPTLPRRSRSTIRVARQRPFQAVEGAVPRHAGLPRPVVVPVDHGCELESPLHRLERPRLRDPRHGPEASRASLRVCGRGVRRRHPQSTISTTSCSPRGAIRSPAVGAHASRSSRDRSSGADSASRRARSPFACLLKWFSARPDAGVVDVQHGAAGRRRAERGVGGGPGVEDPVPLARERTADGLRPVPLEREGGQRGGAREPVRRDRIRGREQPEEGGGDQHVLVEPGSRCGGQRCGSEGVVDDAGVAQRGGQHRCAPQVGVPVDLAGERRAEVQHPGGLRPVGGERDQCLEHGGARGVQRRPAEATEGETPAAAVRFRLGRRQQQLHLRVPGIGDPLTAPAPRSGRRWSPDRSAAR